MTAPRLTATADIFLKGHALPLSYFYKGKVAQQDSFDDPFMGKSIDCDSDIMLEAERSSEEKNEKSPISSNNDEDSNKSGSDPQLKEEAAVIMSQLTDLLDRIPQETMKTYDSALPIRSAKSLMHLGIGGCGGP